MIKTHRLNRARSGSARWAILIAGLAFTVGTAGCDSIFDVNNPNDLVQADLETPSAATALVNGAEATVARGLVDLQLAVSVPTDELVWTGTYDAGHELDKGNLTNPANEFSNSESWGSFNQGRFMADEAVRVMEGWDADGTLKNRGFLARAYLYSAIMYVAAADYYDDFVISDRKVAGAPIGEANMVSLYDTATARLDKGLAIARAVGADDLEAELLAMRARAAFSRGIWEKLNPAGTTPADPLVASAQARTDAEAVLAMVDPDWKYQFEFGPSTIGSQLGSWINSRQEFRVDTVFGVPNAAGTKVTAVALMDPIDHVPDAGLDAILTEFGAFSASLQVYPPFTVVSARELHLIAAEVALAGGDTAGAADHINAVRALGGQTPYSGQVPLLDLLVHERQANLFLQGRRWADMYRFGIQDARWTQDSDARTKPGTFFPIADEEIKSNCKVAGSC